MRQLVTAVLVVGALAVAARLEAVGLYGATTVASGWSSDLAYNRDRGEFLAVFSGWSGGWVQVWARRYRESGEAIGAAVTLTNDAAHVQQEVGLQRGVRSHWDGDGKANLALFDQESGLWRIRTGSLTTNVAFGTVGDISAAR